MNQIKRNNKLNCCFGFLKGRAQKMRRKEKWTRKKGCRHQTRASLATRPNSSPKVHRDNWNAGMKSGVWSPDNLFLLIFNICWNKKILLGQDDKRTKKSLDISFNFLFILGVIKLFYFAEKKTNISLYN
jgi:hypothetical protein